MGAISAMSYMVPLFLGMTFDARNSRPGIDIYDKEFVDNPKVDSFHREDTHFDLVTSRADIQKSLGISGDLALKIKTGMIDVEGKGSYLKTKTDYSNSVTLLATLKYISVTKSLNSKAKPRPAFAKMYSTDALGTHYVRSITYGAELIASVKFVVLDTSNVRNITAEIVGTIGTGGNGTDLVASGKLDMLEKKLKGKANLEISYYGTVPLKTIPNSVEGLTKLINNFAEQIKETGLEEGVPMSVDLNSLEDIADPEDRNKFAYEVNKETQNDLSQFTANMNELLDVRQDLNSYARDLPYDVDKETEIKIGQLIQNLTDILQIHYDILWSMNLTKGREEFKPAFEAYDKDPLASGKYERLARQMKRKVEKTIDRSKNVATATYVHWGRNMCNGSKDTVLLYEGFVFGSSEEGNGGPSEYSCAPKVIDEGYDLDKESSVSSHLAGIRYAEFDKGSNPFKGEFAKDVSQKGVTCAKCYSPSSASIDMFPASEKCPLTWELLYVGYLMSSRVKDGQTTEYICVDETPSMPYKMDNLKPGDNILALTTISTKGSLPEKYYIKGSLIKCVVCAMKNNQISF